MSCYYIEHVFSSRKRDTQYIPGLYALREENKGIDILRIFMSEFSSPDKLNQYYEANRHLIDIEQDAWKKEIQSQLDDTWQRIKRLSNQGDFLADNSNEGRFINIDSGKKRSNKLNIPYTSQIARKYKSVPSSAEFYSYIRIYGLQFGKDLVLVTGASIKLTSTTQDDQSINSIVEETKQWERIFPEYCNPPYLHFQGSHTENLEIEEDEED
jgi:hypothetical protein